MPFNPTAQNEALKSGTGGGVSGAITHVGLHTTATEPGTGTNAAAGEATGGSPAYARQAVTWGTASGGTLANSNTLTFDLPAGTYGWLTFFNASTGNTNNYRGYAPLNGSTSGFAAVDTTLTNDQFLSPGHGLSDTDRVQLFNTFAGSIPTGITEGTLYYVVNSATNTFKVSTTSGGAAVDITALGGGEVYFQKVIPEAFAGQGQLTIAIGAIVLDATAM